MQQIVTGGGKAWLQEAPMPEAQGNEVVVKMRSIPLCGSDMHAFRGAGEVAGGGHEGTGEVVAVDRSDCLHVGDRVALNPMSGCGVCELCRSGDAIFCADRPAFMGHFSEYVRIQDFMCTPLPADLSFDLGALVGCALAPASDCLRRMGLSATHTLLLTGLGPVGLGAVTWAKFHNAQVIGVDPSAWRRERAREIGADVVLDFTDDLREQLRVIVGAPGVPLALDCSGRPEAERLCLDLAGVRGKVGFIGENPGMIEISPSDDLIRRGLSIYSSWHTNLQRLPELITLLRRFPAAELLISHRFTFAHVQEAFETMASGESAKVLLNPFGLSED
jgi:threonine dehydrogenase-like Zn-dependent dehydrogenase